MKKIFAIAAVILSALALNSCSKYFQGNNDSNLVGTWIGQGSVRDESGALLKKALYVVTFTPNQVEITIENTSSDVYQYTSGIADNNERYFTVKAAETYSMFYTVEDGYIQIIGSDNLQQIRSWPAYLSAYNENEDYSYDK